MQRRRCAPRVQLDTLLNPQVLQYVLLAELEKQALHVLVVKLANTEMQMIQICRSAKNATLDLLPMKLSNPFVWRVMQGCIQIKYHQKHVKNVQAGFHKSQKDN